MDKIKRNLNLLNNQYFKSLKRFQKTYCFDIERHTKEFNADYLKLIGAVLKGDANEIRVALHKSLLYIRATINEKDKLNLEILGII